MGRRTRSRRREGAQASGSRDWAAPLACFAVLLALYLSTMAPGVAGGDSGELAAAALTGGVPHPPGYPLHALLARLFAALPIGPPGAWRLNLLSAVSTAAAGGLLARAAQVWTARASGAVVAAGLFGTSPPVWEHAGVTEVFGLGAALAAGALVLWLRCERLRDRRSCAALALLAGLGMANHHTFVFVGLPLLARSVWIARGALGARGFALVVASGIAGLAPYAYLPLASAGAAAVSWGDQTSLEGFLAHVLRRQYGTASMGAIDDFAFVRTGTFVPTLGLFFGGMPGRLLVLGPVLAAAGLVASLRDPSRRAPGLVLAAAFLGYGLTFAALSNLSLAYPLSVRVASRFTILLDLLAALAAAVGWAALVARIGTGWRGAHHAALLAAGALFATGALEHRGGADHRGNNVLRDFVRRALGTLPVGAVIVTVGDHMSGASFYLKEVEKLRPDVVHLDQSLLAFDWYLARARRRHPGVSLPPGRYEPGGWTLGDLVAANPGRDVFVADRVADWDRSIGRDPRIVTLGLVHWLAPAAKVPAFEDWRARTEAALAGYDPGPALAFPVGTWERVVGELSHHARIARGEIALIYAYQRGGLVPAARYALGQFEVAQATAAASPATLPLEPRFWKNLGLAHRILAADDGAHGPRAAAAFRRYLAAAPDGDPMLPELRAYAEAHQGE